MMSVRGLQYAIVIYAQQWQATAAGYFSGLVRANQVQAWFQFAAKRAVEPEARVAGESGVASHSAGFATAVQDTMVAADAWGRSRETATTALATSGNTMVFDELRQFPMISNQFQSIQINSKHF